MDSVGDSSGLPRSPSRKVGPAFFSEGPWPFSGVFSIAEHLAYGFVDKSLEMSPSEPVSLAFRSILEYELGDLDTGDMYLERLLSVMDQTPPGSSLEYLLPAFTIPYIALVTGDDSRLEIAEHAAEIASSSVAITPGRVIIIRVGTALIAVLRDDKVKAAEQYAHLEHLARGAQIGFIINSRILGLLAYTMGNLDDAQSHFEDAIAFCRKAGYRPELAWSLCDYADALLKRNDEGDRQKAMQLLDESLQISTELGMRPLMERVLSRREILKA